MDLTSFKLKYSYLTSYKMEFVESIIAVNNILAQWDPIGVGLVDSRWPFSEYKQYVSGIITAYLKGDVIFDYLISLNLDLNQENISATKVASEQLVNLLSNVHEVQFRNFFLNK